jgi:hypothetical protein
MEEDELNGNRTFFPSWQAWQVWVPDFEQVNGKERSAAAN